MLDPELSIYNKFFYLAILYHISNNQGLIALHVIADNLLEGSI